MGKMDEIIIVAPRKDVFANEKLSFQGVQSEHEAVDAITNNLSENWVTMRRGDAEENPAYKQPIPYCIIRRDDEVFLYKRLGGGGEARLHDKYSIGAGGHMNEIAGLTAFEDVLQENLERELEEELIIDSPNREYTTVGYINDDENEVGKVHIGLLVILDIDGNVEVRETDQLQGEWISIPQLVEEPVYSKLENWSKIAAQVLV